MGSLRKMRNGATGLEGVKRRLAGIGVMRLIATLDFHEMDAGGYNLVTFDESAGKSKPIIIFRTRG